MTLDESILHHLRALVAIDTTNPPRDEPKIHEAVAYCRRVLAGAGFACEVNDLGGGCVNLLAVRGAPALLVNCHLDTVPACDGWTGDPFNLCIESDDAIGLGACDVKGSAACLLASAQQSQGDAAILFTTDEEAGQSACVRTFAREHASRFEGVIVCEPTGCAIVDEHRGLVSVEATFTGQAGHASASAGATRSAIHGAVRWGASALAWSEASNDQSRLAIGVIEGGVKTNMIAQAARMRIGLRNRAGVDPEQSIAALRALDPTGAMGWRERFRGPALCEPAFGAQAAELLGAQRADPVDFWTEASLFAEAGVPSVVYGPGSIAHAHAADERVAITQLTQAATSFASLFTVSAGAPA